MSELKRLILALWEISTPKKKPPRNEIAPEEILDWAKREMEEIHARNRERAVQAITSKNILQQMVDDLEKKILDIQVDREAAEKAENVAVVAKLDRKLVGYEASLKTTRESLVKATEVAEVVKRHIQREQEAIRQNTAEVLALKSRWRASAIELEIERELLRFPKVEHFGKPQFKLETVRNLVGILLAVILVLLAVIGILVATR
jgi:hypothetical protein